MTQTSQSNTTESTLTNRLAEDRFHTDLGWLDSRHTFSFGQHRDLRWQGFRRLRVINDDRVAPGSGFGQHGHRDMEILSWVTSGTLRHEDSLGNGSDIRPNDLQRMSAGTGVLHSELNPSESEPVSFLQIWIEPDQAGHAPGYEQKRFDPTASRASWQLLASQDGVGGSVSLNANVRVLRTTLEPGEEVDTDVAHDRGLWLHVVRGNVTVNGETLSTGDGLGASPGQLEALKITGLSQPNDDNGADTTAELLLFDLD